ncbi:MAG: TerB family tellurite resistance protein [Bacteroidales bacterium]|nr:TerB family tellurite resistance protein [Bacteroidales bacterium]
MKYFITIALILVILYLIGNMDFGTGGKQTKKQKIKKADMVKMRYAKWIGGGLGWAFGGPIGGILGFIFGTMVDGMQSGKFEYKPTQSGDFSISLLVLSAAVMRADGKVMKSELDYVKNFFIRQFGVETANNRIQMLQEILKQDFDLPEVCQQIGQYMEYPSRLQLLHYLFGLSSADGQYNPKEVEMIGLISGYLGIEKQDYESIRAMFVRDINSAYKVLEISPEATEDEVKAAYRKMAVKYHPDKVAHIGEDVQHAAKEKFQQLNGAYEEIKKQRGMK